jgi:hypothetical protein
MEVDIADKYPNETMEILSKVLPEDILNDTSIDLIDILDILLKNRFLWLCKSLEISDFTRTGSRSESARAKWTNEI